MLAINMYYKLNKNGRPEIILATRNFVRKDCENDNEIKASKSVRTPHLISKFSVISRNLMQKLNLGKN